MVYDLVNWVENNNNHCENNKKENRSKKGIQAKEKGNK